MLLRFYFFIIIFFIQWAMEAGGLLGLEQPQHLEREPSRVLAAAPACAGGTALLGQRQDAAPPAASKPPAPPAPPLSAA